MSQPRVLLVEDDYLTGRGCARQLERDGCEVVVAPDARNARSLAATRRWSAAVIDIGLPDGSGVDLAKEMRGSAPELPILLFTGREDRAFANLAQELGAEFLYKPAAPVNIAAFVRRVVDRAAGSHERLRRATSAYGRHFALTEAEHRLLLEALRLGGRRGLEDALGVSANTVKFHIRGILRKTGCSSLEEVLRASVTHALAI